MPMRTGIKQVTFTLFFDNVMISKEGNIAENLQKSQHDFLLKMKDKQ